MNHLVIVGGNPEPFTNGASVIEGESEGTQAHTALWYSAAIMHYTGNGLWSIGLIPDVNHSKWEWFEEVPISGVGRLLAGIKFRRCPTETLTERLRENQS